MTDEGKQGNKHGGGGVNRQLAETTGFIRRKFAGKPILGFILGSGLSGFAKRVKAEAELAFQEIPHFSAASVEGHPGRLLLGELEGVAVAVMQGRLHAYEGLSLQQVIYPVRTLAALGVQALLISNAAGGLRKTMRAGDFMIIIFENISNII